MTRLILALGAAAALVAGTQGAFADTRQHEPNGSYMYQRPAAPVEVRQDNNRVWSYYRWRENEHERGDRDGRNTRPWWYRLW